MIMKKQIIVALLFACSASLAFAADVPAKKSAKKTACDDQYHDQYHDHYRGMMGGQGMMMDAGRYHMLNLSADQQAKISTLSDQFNHDNWAKQGMINDESAKLRDLYEADKRDPAAIGEEYKKIFDLKRQMIEAYLTVQNQIDDVLTPEQRAQMKALYQHHMR